MNESGFWQSLRKKIAGRIYTFKINDRRTAGIPDFWASGSEQDMWVETKYLQKLPKQVPIDCRSLLSERQKQWLVARHKEGRKVAVLLGSPQGSRLFLELTWQRPITTEDFLFGAMTTKEMADWIVTICGETS